MSEQEQMYVFVDKSGNCFDEFGELPGNGMIYAWLKKGKEFSVGDMMVFSDDLKEAGFEWGTDFYTKKV